MMISYDYVHARMADQWEMAERHRAASPRPRRGSAHRIGTFLRQRSERSDDVGGFR